MHNKNQSGQNPNEFARASINSASSRGENSTISDEEDDDDSSQRVTPFEMFRGTGQNGQILKEDLKKWSRKLHINCPENMYTDQEIPYR